MVIVALLIPSADGSKVICIVVESPAATTEAGAAVTEKSAAWIPVIVMPEIFRTSLPVLLILNVLITVPEQVSNDPKSVESATSGNISPSVISVKFPRTLISGATGGHAKQDAGPSFVPHALENKLPEMTVKTAIKPTKKN